MFETESPRVSRTSLPFTQRDIWVEKEQGRGKSSYLVCFAVVGTATVLRYRTEYGYISAVLKAAEQFNGSLVEWEPSMKAAEAAKRAEKAFKPKKNRKKTYAEYKEKLVKQWLKEQAEKQVAP